jgi:putative membrane protein insertion efficiency factor
MKDDRTEPTPIAKVLMLFISVYQRVRVGRPSPCHFVPSCSSYALEAIELHGAGRGAWLAFKRIMRCRPFGSRGFDPVPG